jgi:hypothetical protein
MQAVRRQKASSFLSATVGREVDKGTADKKNVQEAREMMNEMIFETQGKLDKEEVQCEESIRNQGDILDQTRAEISLYKFQATQAGGDVIRAETSKTSLQDTLGKSREELEVSIADCHHTEILLKQQIEVMENDSAILQKIVEMVECPKASFLQCRDAHGNTTTSFGHPELRAQMTHLQSNKAKALLNGAVVLGYSTGEQKVAMRKVEPLENPEMPQDQEGCSLATNPNCGKLLDKFLEIAGELDSDITKFKQHLAEHLQKCSAEHEVYETQISDITSRLGTWQTALA